MNTVLWMLVGIVANMIVGAGVWAVIDDRDKRLYSWYKDCQPKVVWLAQPLVLTAWPIGLWLWWKRHNEA